LQHEIDSILYAKVYAFYIIINRYEMKQDKDNFNSFEMKISKCFNELMRLLRLIYGDDIDEFEY